MVTYHHNFLIMRDCIEYFRQCTIRVSCPKMATTEMIDISRDRSAILSGRDIGFIKLISRLLPQIKYIQRAKLPCEHGTLDDVRGDCFGEFFGACFGGEVEHGTECIDEELIAMRPKGRVWATPTWSAPGGGAFNRAVREVVAANFCGSGWEIPDNPVVEAANKGCVGAIAHHGEALGAIRDVADSERRPLVAAKRE